jgi:hypothetical protein
MNWVINQDKAFQDSLDVHTVHELNRYLSNMGHQELKIEKLTNERRIIWSGTLSQEFIDASNEFKQKNRTPEELLDILEEVLIMHFAQEILKKIQTPVELERYILSAYGKQEFTEDGEFLLEKIY